MPQERAEKRIDELPILSEVTGTEELPVSDNDVAKRVTVDKLKQYIFDSIGRNTSGLTAIQKRNLIRLFRAALYSENVSGVIDELEESFVSTVDRIILSESALSFSGISTQTLGVTFVPADATGTVYWTSSNSSVATVSADGKVTAVGNGTCSIVATVGSVSAACLVTVEIAGLYSITNNLSHVINSNAAESIYDGQEYSCTLTADTDYAISAVTVTMGGEDITATVYSNGVISISDVTGDIVITAVATIPGLLYNWDLTKSLTDTVDGRVLTLGYKDTVTNEPASLTDNGLVFTDDGQWVGLGAIYEPGRLYEFDFSENSVLSGTTNLRLIMLGNTASDSNTWSALIFNRNDYKTYKSGWPSTSYGVTNRNAFSGHTMKLSFDASGYPTLYIDNTQYNTSDQSFDSTHPYMFIGTNDATNLGSLTKGMIITAIRVKET